jgi:hypothetical protein
MQRKFKLNSDGHSGSKKCKRGYDGVWWSLESGGQFCVCAFGRNLASVTVKMISHLICSIKRICELCTVNVICKDNAAINCISIQHKKGSFLSTLAGHTTLVFSYLFKFLATGEHFQPLRYQF